jgi:hypothetical protein
VTLLVHFLQSYKAINWQVIFTVPDNKQEQQWSTGTAKLAAEQLFGLFGNWADCIVVYTLFFKFHFNGNYNKQCYCRASQLLFLQQILWG